MKKITLLPADTYVVINKTILHNEDRKILTLLYLPIIGPEAVMLYFSLWTCLDSIELMSRDFSHQKLMSSMHMTISEIENLRYKLEAIGLMKSFVKEGDINNYIYELYSPVSAIEFFSHPILNIVLYSNVGKTEYNNLLMEFKMPKINKNNYNEITKGFSDVFESASLTSYDLSLEDIRKYNKLKLNINSNFDFNFLMSTIPKNIEVTRVFTKEIKELIINLSFIYEIDAVKMSNIIKGCFNERGTINKDELRRSARNYYQFDHGGILPTIIDNSQPEYLRKPIGDTSKRAKMIYTFETISPKDLLITKNKGNDPTRRDLKLIEDLLIDYGLKPGVVNVLIDYILNINENKLTRSLVETLAGEWQRLGIETVEEAMANAEKEHKKRKRKSTQKEVKFDKTPLWFDKEPEKKELSKDDEKTLEELLKEYK